MKKIVIIGSTGSGKSTLAKKLSQKLELAYIDLDDFHHLPGWKERTREEFCELTEAATRGGAWVVAGNYLAKAADITWPRADTLIWIDLPFFFNLKQLLKRSFKRAATQEIICNGNRETLGKLFFSKDSILLWLLRSHHKNRKRYGKIFAHPEAYPHLTLIRLRSNAESDAFIAGL